MFSFTFLYANFSWVFMIISQRGSNGFITEKTIYTFPSNQRGPTFSKGLGPLCYSFTLLISYNMVLTFNPFKMAAQFFWIALSFPNIDDPNAFFPKFNRPLASNSKRLEKSLNCTSSLLSVYLSSKIIIKPWHGISNNVVCATSKASDQPAHTRSLIRAFASRLNILWVLSYWLNIIWSFKAKQEAAQAHPSLHSSKCHIVGNHMSRLICV